MYYDLLNTIDAIIQKANFNTTAMYKKFRPRSSPLQADLVESVAERKPESGKQLLDIMSQLFAHKCSL